MKTSNHNVFKNNSNLSDFSSKKMFDGEKMYHSNTFSDEKMYSNNTNSPESLISDKVLSGKQIATFEG